MRIQLLIALLISSLSIIAQVDHPVLAGFSIKQIGNEVHLDFTIRGGEFCLGAILQRSSDQENFTDIEIIPGICGGTEFDESYRLTDASPIPYSISWYRLNLGGLDPEPAIEFRFVPLIEGVAVSPNPAADQVQIRFDNPSGLPHSLMVYQSNGQLVYREENLRHEQVSLALAGWSAGVYTFLLTAPSLPDRRGKFVVYSPHD